MYKNFLLIKSLILGLFIDFFSSNLPAQPFFRYFTFPIGHVDCFYAYASDFAPECSKILGFPFGAVLNENTSSLITLLQLSVNLIFWTLVVYALLILIRYLKYKQPDNLTPRT